MRRCDLAYTGQRKSLTMVMVAKYLLLELQADHPRVVIVTDRKELDKQITATFAHTRLRPAHATNGRHLLGLVTDERVDIVTSIINKFSTAERLDGCNKSQDILFLWTKATAPITAKCHIKCGRFFRTPAISVLQERP